jgi:hypothetical protein
MRLGSVLLIEIPAFAGMTIGVGMMNERLKFSQR